MSAWWRVRASQVVLGGRLSARAGVRRRRRRLSNAPVCVLVVGAGVVGTTYSAAMADKGMDVTLIARGERLEQIQAHGPLLRVGHRRELQSAPVRVLSSLPSAPEFDLAVVAVRSPQSCGAMGSVEPIAATTPVLVIQSNVAGPEAMLARLGHASVLMGFPGVNGALVDGTVVLASSQVVTTQIGESDGAATQRLQQAASILKRAGLGVVVQPHVVSTVRERSAFLAIRAASLLADGAAASGESAEPGTESSRLAIGEALAILQHTHGRAENHGGASVRDGSGLTPARSPSQDRMSWSDTALLYRAVNGADEVEEYLTELLDWASEGRISAPHLTALSDLISSR